MKLIQKWQNTKLAIITAKRKKLGRVKKNGAEIENQDVSCPTSLYSFLMGNKIGPPRQDFSPNLKNCQQERQLALALNIFPKPGLMRVSRLVDA